MPAIDSSADAEPLLPTEDSKHFELLPTDSSDWDLWLCDDVFSPLHSPSGGSFSSKRKSEDDGFSSGDELCRKRVRRFTSPSTSRSPLNRRRLHLPQAGDEFLDFCAKPRAAFVDKTRFPFQLPENYQYLLLRPPQFGKTVFLSMLSQFYDIHGLQKFSHYFKTPEAAQNCLGRPDHSQHLCLFFTFTDARVYMNAGAFADQLRGELFFGLKSFLVKYATELGLSDPHEYLEYGENASLKKVLDLVKSRGQTLFVGVDSYDAPLRQSMLSHLVQPANNQTFATPKDAEQLLDLYFWGPLQGGGDVIAKLFVTGTLSLQTTILQNLVSAPDLQTCCGFTEDESLHFARSLLQEPTPNINELRGRCGDYLFSSDESSGDLVLHPQILIDCISGLSSQQPEGHPFHLLSSLLDLRPSDSDVQDTVTLEALVQLIATGGVVDIEGDLVSGRDLDGNSVFWSALYHAGALTRARDSRSTLRVANREVLSLIHSRIDGLVHDRYDPHDRGNVARELQDPHGFFFDEDPDERLNFLTTLRRYDFDHEHQPLLALLSQVLRDLTLRSLGKKREPNVRGVLELMMRNALCMPSESLQRTEPIILLPTDVTRVRIIGYRPHHVHEWELTTLTLRGMWQAANPNETDPSAEALRELHEKLCQEDEEKLLARPYSMWSESLNALETVPVRSFFDAETKHTRLIAVGGARILRRAGP